jgi:hypothetical protein
MKETTKMDIFTASEYAYKNGYEAGKASAAEEIFADIENMLRAQEAQCENKRLADIGNWIFHEYLPLQIAELKKKHGVK